MGMLSRTLASRPELERLIRMADSTRPGRRPRQRRSSTISKGIQILQMRAVTNLYSLAYRDRDRRRPSGSSSRWSLMFVESGLGASRKDTGLGQDLPERADQTVDQAGGGRGAAEEFRLRTSTARSATARTPPASARISTQLEPRG